MKRLIFIALAVTLVLSMVWASSVAALGPYPISITKIIGPGNPIEDFTFEAWRDLNNNGIIDDPGDILVGTVIITGAGTGVIDSPFMGNTIIHEVLIPGSAYEQPPDQIVMVPCGEITFENETECTGQIEILKLDPAGLALVGATFEITPDPKTGTGSLTVADNGLNDEDPADGVLRVTGCQVCIPVTVTETQAPDGYDLDPTPYPAHVTACGETVTLTIVNIPPELGELIILKQDGSGNALAGATFEICPNPKTGELPCLTVVDEGLNDEALGQPGVLSVGDCIIDLVCTVEETEAPAGYDPAPIQTVTISALVELTFVNTKCELTIYKVDGSGESLAGACFTITPDPRTGADSLVLCDNGPDDECPADGVLCLSELMCGLTCTVEETTIPDGYQGAAPQTVTIGETVELTFENTRELSCGTVCAAQTAPGEFLFSDEQDNWFTWIYYDIGWGTEASPYEYPIYTGQTHLCGTLYVYDDGTHIFVNYVLTDMGACTLAGLSEYHLQVDESFNDLKKAVVKKKNPIPGKCEYKDTFDPMVSETGWIEAVNDDISDWTTAYIFAHGVGCYYCP